MERRARLEFGPGPIEWGLVGCFVCLVGLVFTVFGLAMVSIDSSNAIADVLGWVLLLAGGVCMWAGVMDVIWRRELKVILDEDAVRIIEITRDCTISYTDIEMVRLGMDSMLVIERVDPPRVFELWTGNFASDEEVNRFIEELRNRVENAKQPPESLPADS